MPHNYEFTSGGDLQNALGYDNNEALRRCVERCRGRLTKLAKATGAAPPAIGMVIESSSWCGYRLHPDNVRLVALSEIGEGQIGDATPAPRRRGRNPRAPKSDMR